MKRSIIFIVILLAVMTVCIGQPRKRVLQRQIIQLPGPVLMGPISVEHALASRRDSDRFAREQLNYIQLSQLAWAGRGIVELETLTRTAPSAEQGYPISLYFVTQQGAFVYNPQENNFEQIVDEDLRYRLATTAVDQQAVADASCNIIIAGSVKKGVAKNASKAKKNMFLEAGHIAQNILLQAVSMELAAEVIWDFDARTVRNIAKLPKNTEALHMISLGLPEKESEQPVLNIPEQKRAVLIIAGKLFNNDELFGTQSQLEIADIGSEIASLMTGEIRGLLGGRVEATVLLDNLVVDDYDAIIFIGGSSVRDYFNDPTILAIVREAFDKNKVIAAISRTPTILANAGVLDGLRVASFASERRKLQDAGAIWMRSEVERDGLIITAADSAFTEQFGRAIAKALKD